MSSTETVLRAVYTQAVGPAHRNLQVFIRSKVDNVKAIFFIIISMLFLLQHASLSQVREPIRGWLHTSVIQITRLLLERIFSMNLPISLPTT